MSKTIALGLAAAFLLNVPCASAGVFTDDMSKCLVRASSPEDQAALIRFIFAAMALNPNVASLSAMNAEQRNETERMAASLLQRLLLKDCRTETVAALKNEGIGAIEASFGVLGQVAMRGLMADPNVAANLRAFGDGLDRRDLNELLKEAGIQPGPGRN